MPCPTAGRRPERTRRHKTATPLQGDRRERAGLLFIKLLPGGKGPTRPTTTFFQARPTETQTAKTEPAPPDTTQGGDGSDARRTRSGYINSARMHYDGYPRSTTQHKANKTADYVKS